MGWPNGPAGFCARSWKVVTEPGTCRAWFSITSAVPNRCRIAAIAVARCGSLPGNLAVSSALPNPALAGGGVLVATAPPTTVAASATVTRLSTSSCCRHSRRNSRQAHRITARRAGPPPLAGPAGCGPGAGAGAGRSWTVVLIARARA